AGVITLIAYVPLAVAVWIWAPAGTIGLVWLWIGFGGGYMLARAITTGVRAAGEKWMIVGVQN
ncbi:MAG TPA: MATE family efflux transporter, partial [Beutenbergiaceae bacterium]|nr:MATE family efflux transporter [Beutenbergiaceae bacterium]